MVGHFRKPHVHNREIGERGEGLQDAANGRPLAREAARRSAQAVDPSKRRPYAAPLGGSRAAQEEEANGRSAAASSCAAYTLQGCPCWAGLI